MQFIVTRVAPFNTDIAPRLVGYANTLDEAKTLAHVALNLGPFHATTTAVNVRENNAASKLVVSFTKNAVKS